jgi:hypothetical protein
MAYSGLAHFPTHYLETYALNPIMKKYNKIVIASEMFERAHDQFVSAQSEMDYASSLLLAGAIVGIIAPLLAEQGGHPTHDLLVRIGNVISEHDGENHHVGLYRTAYNSLKHAGNDRKKFKPSEDLEFETDIRLEAARMLDAAKADFKEITVTGKVHQQFSQSFIELLGTEREYA